MCSTMGAAVAVGALLSVLSVLPSTWACTTVIAGEALLWLSTRTVCGVSRAGWAVGTQDTHREREREREREMRCESCWLGSWNSRHAEREKEKERERKRERKRERGIEKEQLSCVMHGSRAANSLACASLACTAHDTVQHTFYTSLLLGQAGRRVSYHRSASEQGSH